MEDDSETTAIKAVAEARRRGGRDVQTDESDGEEERVSQRRCMEALRGGETSRPWTAGRRVELRRDEQVSARRRFPQRGGSHTDVVNQPHSSCTPSPNALKPTRARTFVSLSL